MKKLFIGLLIIAAGAGAYYFLQMRKKTSTKTLQKEMLTGKWKMDSLINHRGDSSVSFIATLLNPLYQDIANYRYEFRPNGQVLQSLKDSLKTDTSYYEWDKTDKLLFKESQDAGAEPYLVSKLNAGSLVIESHDSTRFFFSRME